MPTKWRDFEQLVARIEETLGPKGAVVRSPDRVRDLVTGRLREVDASIRFEVGSTPILITVECRKRGSVQDDTWIEQLATKRAKIGAAKTVAVSATDFSDSAKKSARLYGIELRTLEDRIGEEIVQQFLSGIKISILVTEYATRTIAFELEDGTPLLPSDFGPDLLAGLATQGVSAVIATEAATARVLTIKSVVERINDRSIPEDGSLAPRMVQVAFPPHTFMMSTRDGPRFIRRLEIGVDFTQRDVPAPATSLYEYATPDTLLRHTIEAVGQISENEGVRLLVDIESPALERRIPTEKQNPKTRSAS